MAFNKAKALQEAEKSVSQGKTAQAIKQYLLIFEKEPTDLSLLNTVGDLYVRDKNMPEALKQFHKLADSYTQEGFTVKAIAIFKKISKLDPSGVDVLLKMAELYTVQGLGREAREQYSQAVEYYKKKNLNDKALEIYRKIVALDPDNANYRLRLADFLESLGKKPDATKVYIETVESALRRGDTATIDLAMKKAMSLEANNPQLQFLRARIALSKNQPDEVEKIITSTPELASDPAARQILLEAYLSGHKLDAAQKMIVEVFRANPADFSSMASFVDQCIGNGEYDAALKPLAAVADLMMENKNHGLLMEALRKIWAKSPTNIPALELISRVAEKTADEFTLPEALDALGNAYVKAGELEKAEGVYRQLVAREPENEQLKGLLKQVLQKLGKEPQPAKAEDLSNVEMALTPDSEAATAPAAEPSAEESKEAAVMKEAMDNCDLFNRYGLMDKAFAELDKVLATYPEQIEIYKRMLEIAQKSDNARAGLAARALARIYAERGDSANARKYEQMAASPGQLVPDAAPEPPAPAAPVTPQEAAPPVATEFDLSAEFLGAVPTDPPTPAPTQVPAESSPPVAAAPTPPPVQEFDLSMGFETPPPPEAPPLMDAPLAEAEPPQVAPEVAEPSGFNFEDSKVEIDYYLDQGFLDEARAAVKALEERFPGNAQVAELRARMEQRLAPPPEEEKAVAEEPAPVPEPKVELPPPVAPPEPPVAVAPPVQEQAPVAPPPPLPTPPPQVPVQASPPLPPPAAVPADPLGGLIGDLEESLAGIETEAPPPPPPKAKPQAPTPAASAPSSPATASPLSGFLDELGEADQMATGQDDPQTHYDLGVAFREMNLLDEAIGEFQKVLKGAQKGQYPPNFLQVCTLLALCFMDKKLPGIAAKWYVRALEFPELDEEAIMAVTYDLGMAYEQAGDAQKALEKFSEVYSQNIDYRDVAEKIRQLQTKS
ncbi:MAG TPA: tetratricopeptide repeat protein [Terriglobia bacterium]|nr:tetratricopeptide repeat protein [Terriglobia bacterium]